MKSGLYLYLIISVLLSLFVFINPNDDETKKPLVICNKYTCPKSRGICNEDNECVCVKGYDTIDDLSRGDFYCNYKKRSKLITFLLEFVLGFGAGHFYLGNYLLATIKMIYTCCTCLFFCRYHDIKVIPEYKRFAIPLEKFTLLGWALWQIIDGFLIYFGVYKDSNGHEMISW